MRPVVARLLVAVFMILGIGLVLGLINILAHSSANDLIAALPLLPL